MRFSALWYTLFCFFFSAQINAQDFPAPRLEGAEKYRRDIVRQTDHDCGSARYVHTPQGKVCLNQSTSLALVKFREGISFERQEQFLSGFSSLKKLKPGMLLPWPRAALVHFSGGSTEREVDKVLSALKSYDEVEYANPFLVYENGVLLGIQDVVYVQLKNGNLNQLEELAKANGAKIVGPYEYTPTIYEVKIEDPSQNALDVANLFFESGLFQFAEPDFLQYGGGAFNTNDTYVNDQWALNNTGQVSSGTLGADMNVFDAWGITTGASSVRIAILDSGVDLGHPDLVGNLVSGYDATNQGSGGGPLFGTHPNNAHGTACAGIAAAVGNNNEGIAGVAYGCKIVPIRIAYIDGQGNWVGSNSASANAINWAWNQGSADVLSNSWGGGIPSFLLDNAIENATEQGRGGLGSVVLFATGNDDWEVSYPASNWRNVAVGATSMCDERKNPFSCDGESWWGSNYGTNIDVSAPGVTIMATDMTGNDGYNPGAAYPSDVNYTGFFNGTSSACPNAAGVMGLILSANPDLDVWEARGVLEATCDKVGGYSYSNGVPGQPAGSWSSELGHGRVNAYEAVLAAGGTSGCEDNQVTVQIILDDFGSETTWEVLDGTTVIASGGPYGDGLNGASVGSFLCLPDGCYEFVIYDSYGDGICCEYGEGHYELSDEDGNVLASGGEFGSVESTTFCLNAGSTCPAPTNLEVVDKGYAFFYVEWQTVNGAEEYQSRQRKQGTSDWEYGSWFSSPGVIWGNREPCSTYEVQVRARCGGQDGDFSSSVSVSTDCSGSPYCYSYGIAWNYWIDRVEIADLEWDSGTDYGYNDFTNVAVAHVQAGETYPIVLYPGMSPSTDEPGSVYWKIWVDWNKNNSFEEPSEVALSYITSGQTVVDLGVIEIPTTALSDNYRMRVSYRIGDSSTPCQVEGQMEVEDYTLNVAAGCPPPTAPTVMANGSTNPCPGNSVTLMAGNVCSGCTVEWSNGMTGQTITVSASGNYQAMNVHPDCGASGFSNTVTVTYQTIATPPIITVLSGNTQLCQGETAVLNATNICTGCTIEWSNEMTGNNITVSTSGTYTAVSINDCGESLASNPIDIEVYSPPSPPIVTANGSTDLCPGQTVQLEASNICSGCSVLWSNGMTSSLITVSDAGLYTAASSRPGNPLACQKSVPSNSVSVNSVSSPSAPVVSSNGSTSLCPGESVELEATNICSGCSVVWSNGMTGTPIIVSDPGTYSATVVSPDCGNSQPSSPIVVIALSLPSVAPEIQPQGSIELCEGQSVILNVTNASSCQGCQILWSNSDEGQTTEINAEGSYTATFSNECGTGTWSTPSTVVTVEFVPEIPVNNGCFLAAPNGSDFQWMLNGDLIAGENSQFFEATETGYYSLMMTNSDGCEGTSQPLFVDCASTSASEEMNKDWAISVYPNPASLYVEIELNLPKEEFLDFEIFTISGALVRSYAGQRFPEGKSKIKLSLGGLADGSYFIRFMGNKKVAVARFFAIHAE